MAYALVDRRPTTPVGRRVVVCIHSCPRSLVTQVGWLMAEVAGVTSLGWDEQPLEPASQRTEITVTRRSAVAAALASRLAGLGRLRFEILVMAQEEGTGERYCSTPRLGLHRCLTDGLGEVLVPEGMLRGILAGLAPVPASRTPLSGLPLPGMPATETPTSAGEGIAVLLGVAWEEELEPFRAVRHLKPEVNARVRGA